MHSSKVIMLIMYKMTMVALVLEKTLKDKLSPELSKKKLTHRHAVTHTQWRMAGRLFFVY